MIQPKAIVIGAGIVGLASARALADKGYAVTVVERSPLAVGASVRNFGMVWPIGQPMGELYEAAIRSREIWKESATAMSLPVADSGSLHLAYEADEWQVLQELYELFSAEGRPVRLMQPPEIASEFTVVKTEKLLGGLYSRDELIVDPRNTIAALPSLLAETKKISFRWSQAVTGCRTGAVQIDGEWIPTDVIVICSGQDFETLYPSVYSSLPITRCKLQMMRFRPAPKDQPIGTALCGGLSLIHYASFKAAPSLASLRMRYEEQLPDYLRHGIHVMVSQQADGQLTVGDSHTYGLHLDPFDDHRINQMILSYLNRFAHTASWTPVQTWHGVYPKLTDGNPYLFMSPEQGVFLMNGLGGAGMTLSFGITEKLLANI